MGDAVVGVVANPLSGRDIRRLVTQATVFPTAEKASMIQRMLTAFQAVGVDRVLLSTDLGGISAAVLRAIGQRRSQGIRLPEVEFLDGQPIRQTAQDTVDAVRRMVAAGARVVVCLGGDGTARVAATAIGDAAMLPLSTGTNNVFPVVREATIAGLAAGLVATGAVPAESATTRAKLLEAQAGGRAETALVDVAVSTERHVGARAVWDPATLTQVFCAFAEPDAIGLSSILGQLAPVSRARAARGPRPDRGQRAAAGAGADRARPRRPGRGDADRGDGPGDRLSDRSQGRGHRRRRRARAHVRAGRPAHGTAAHRRAAVRGRAGGPGRERPPRPARR